MSDDFKKSSGNLFLDLGEEKDVAADLQLRVELMIWLRRYIKVQGLRQVDAARIFGISQSDVSNIYNRKFQHFSVERLVRIITRVGKRVELTIHDEECTEEENLQVA